MKELSSPCLEILDKLIRQHCIGGKHIPENLCLKHITHYGREQYRQGIKDLETCIKEGLIIITLKPGQRHFSLNPKKLLEIKRLVQEEEL